MISKLIKNKKMIQQNLQKTILFVIILKEKIKEKLILVILLAILYFLLHYFKLNTICDYIVNVFITIIIYDSIDTFYRVLNSNFELVKNIFIEKCWRIYKTLLIKEKNIKDENEIKNEYKLLNTDLTKTIFEKIKNSPKIYKPDDEYLKELFNKIPNDINLFIIYLIPQLKNIAITNRLYRSVNQLEFEFLRAKELNSSIMSDSCVNMELSLNHLLHALENVWKDLYNEQKFYNIDNYFMITEK